MQAGTDVSLNSNFSLNVPLAPASRFAGAPTHLTGNLLMEPGFNPWAALAPLHPASVYSAPVVLPTAAVGKNPWDATFGPIGVQAEHGDLPVPALILAPQVGTSSNA